MELGWKSEMNIDCRGAGRKSIINVVLPPLEQGLERMAVDEVAAGSNRSVNEGVGAGVAVGGGGGAAGTASGGVPAVGMSWAQKMKKK